MEVLQEEGPGTDTTSPFLLPFFPRPPSSGTGAQGTRWEFRGSGDTRYTRGVRVGLWRDIVWIQCGRWSVGAVTVR